jgi:hypothetical protein
MSDIVMDEVGNSYRIWKITLGSVVAKTRPNGMLRYGHVIGFSYDDSEKFMLSIAWAKSASKEMFPKTEEYPQHIQILL